MPAKSEKQERFMRAVAHSPSFAKKVGVPMSVGREFTKAGGGEMKESKAMMKKEVSFMKKKGAPKSMIKHEMAEAGMKKMAKGGDVFVLDMGEPVKIYDLAKRMIELSGLTVREPVGNQLSETNRQDGKGGELGEPLGDIEIVITSLRPGEKLYEELLIGENPVATSHPRIMMAREDFLPWPELTAELNILQENLGRDDFVALIAQLKRLVQGYQPFYAKTL